MSYDEEIEKTGIREHPLTAFQNMGSLSEGDDFATQFAELLDILSKNIVIPVELIDENADVFSDYEGGTKEDILKEWAAGHAKGEEVYAKMGGSLQIIDVPTGDDIGPDDVDVKGVGGGLEELIKGGEPGDALLIGEDGISTGQVSIDLSSVTVESGEKTVSVSDYFHETSFILTSAPGGDGSGASGDRYSSDGGDGASGLEVQGVVDLTDYDELKLVVPDTDESVVDGYNDGEDGGNGGHGGGSAALLGDGELLVEAGGGGGGGQGQINYTGGDDGGDGGGKDGVGGSGGPGNEDGGATGDGGDGEVGDYAVYIDSASVTSTSESSEPIGVLFS